VGTKKEEWNEMRRLKFFTPILLTVALIASVFALPVAAAEIAMAKNTVQHPGDPVHPVDVYLVGQEVHYEMSITNTNATTPMTIQITDIDPSGTTWYYIEGTDSFELVGPASDVTLDPLEVWEHDFHHILQLGDLDPHPVLAGINIFTNTLAANGLQGIDIVDVTVGKTARAVVPDISVTKEADTEVSKVGDEINYTITIENTGDWPLVDVTVVDDVLGDLSALFVDTLAPGDSDTQVIPYVVPDPEPADPLVNEVTATGLAENFDADVVAVIGPVVMDTATDSVDLVHPDIAIEKTADTAVSKAGDTVNYSIEIFNTGDVELINVEVTDSLAAASPWLIASILPGDSEVINFAYVVQEGDPDPLVNTATATGYLDGLDNVIGPVEVSWSVDLVHPDIAIEKTADTAVSKAGDTVNYSIEIFNTGDVELINVEVTDSLAAASPWLIASILPGDSEVINFAYVVQEGDPDPLVNTATATGYLDGLDNVIGPVEVSWSVDLVHPDIAIEKTADVDFSKVGDTVNYTIEVFNTGDVELINVEVTDSLAAASPWVIASILPGDSEVINFAYVVQEGDPDPLVNTATATGYLDGLDNVIGPVEASVSTPLVHPAIQIVKECDPDSGSVGDIITYTITITNTGDVDLENVTVWDSLLGDLSASFVDYLAVGDSDTQMFDRAIEAGDVSPLVNTARVDATVIVLGNEVWDEDSCEVIIEEEEEFQGCTPGFWKNNADKWDAVAWVPTGYSPDDSFSSVFGVVIEIRAGGRNTITDPTLLEALGATGGGINALARAATAALLNAAHPDINYPTTEAEVIAAVQAAIADGDEAIKMLAEELDMYNNAGCSIDMHGNIIV
jgi:uncharacterized repeat protein (TIGR01451 family)